MSSLATATKQRSAESPRPPRLVETDLLAIHPDDPLTVDRLLRRLEVLRKRLSVRWCGIEGAFAGYDKLNVGNLSGTVDGTIVLEARLVDADETSHVLELVATRSTGPTTDGQVLVHGTGRALQTRGPGR